MLPKQYSLIIANRASGALRQLTIPVRPALTALAIAVAIPSGLIIHSQWSATTEIGRLKLLNARLEVENSSYRAAGNELSDQMASLSGAMSELAARAETDPSMMRSMEALPGPSQTNTAFGSASAVAPDTFDRLHGLLGSLDDRLKIVRRGVAYREALSAATPMIRPADGWISGRYGYREDPFTGERDFHAAVDISTQKGQPVYATATGRVFSAERSGNYGKLVEIDHGFDLTTRYGHLEEFAVAVGDTVQRGDVIGYVGATGRATGYHVHYEIWSADRTIDPMRLWAQPSTASAN